MSTQMQRRPPDQLAGTFRDESDLNARLKQAQEQCHLVAPATSVGCIPEGCGIALSVVLVDAQNDTYDVGMGKRGLSKHVLEKIAAAIGVTWDPVASRRLDDGSDPRYVHWRAVGSYTSFNGKEVHIVGEKEMDLRPRSPQVEALEERARAKNKSAANQIREMRLHIAAHAETKARLRAIRSLGLKTAYTAEELRKPFLTAQIVFTGQTNSPELRRMFAEGVMNSFLGGRRALYGADQAGGAPLRLVSPPQVGAVAADDDDGYDGDGYGDDRGGTPPQQSRKSEPPPAQSASPERGDQKPAQTGGRKPGGLVMPFGRSADVPLSEAPIEDVEWMATHIQKQLDGKKSKFPDKDEALLKALHAEIAAREQEGDAPAAQGGEKQKEMY